MLQACDKTLVRQRLRSYCALTNTRPSTIAANFVLKSCYRYEPVFDKLDIDKWHSFERRNLLRSIETYRSSNGKAGQYTPLTRGYDPSTDLEPTTGLVLQPLTDEEYRAQFMMVATRSNRKKKGRYVICPDYSIRFDLVRSLNLFDSVVIDPAPQVMTQRSPPLVSGWKTPLSEILSKRKDAKSIGTIATLTGHGSHEGVCYDWLLDMMLDSDGNWTSGLPFDITGCLTPKGGVIKPANIKHFIDTITLIAPLASEQDLGSHHSQPPFLSKSGDTVFLKVRSNGDLMVLFINKQIVCLESDANLAERLGGDPSVLQSHISHLKVIRQRYRDADADDSSGVLAIRLPTVAGNQMRGTSKYLQGDASESGGNALYAPPNKVECTCTTPYGVIKYNKYFNTVVIPLKDTQQRVSSIGSHVQLNANVLANEFNSMNINNDVSDDDDDDDDDDGDGDGSPVIVRPAATPRSSQREKMRKKGKQGPVPRLPSIISSLTSIAASAASSPLSVAATKAVKATKKRLSPTARSKGKSETSAKTRGSGAISSFSFDSKAGVPMDTDTVDEDEGEQPHPDPEVMAKIQAFYTRSENHHRVVPNDGDGNCLFLACSHDDSLSSYEIEMNAHVLRKEVCDHLQHNIAYYLDFFAGSNEEEQVAAMKNHIKSMRNENEYATAIEVAAAVQVLKCDIVVISYEGTVICDYRGAATKGETITLRFGHEEVLPHYERMYDRNDMVENPSGGNGGDDDSSEKVESVTPGSPGKKDGGGSSDEYHDAIEEDINATNPPREIQVVKYVEKRKRVPATRSMTRNHTRGSATLVSNASSNPQPKKRPYQLRSRRLGASTTKP